jgi:hypothetical protein
MLVIYQVILLKYLEAMAYVRRAVLLAFDIAS